MTMLCSWLDTVLDYKTQLDAERKIFSLEKHISRVSSPVKVKQVPVVEVEVGETNITPELLDHLKTSLKKTLDNVNVIDKKNVDGRTTPLSLEGSVVDLLDVQPNIMQIVRSDTAERSRRSVREQRKLAIPKPDSPTRPITPLYVDEELVDGISGTPVRIRSRQEDRNAALSAVSLKKKEKEMEEDNEMPVHIEDTIPLGNNMQFSINIDIRSTGSPAGSTTGPGSRTGSRKNIPMDTSGAAPMSAGVEGIDRPYSRATLLAVTPSTKSRTLQDYFQDPEFDVSDAVNKSREQRLSQPAFGIGSVGSRHGFSRQTNETVPEHVYGEGGIDGEDSEIPFLPSISQAMTAPSVGGVIGEFAPIPPTNTSDLFQFDKGSYSNSMFDESYSEEEEEDDEEYMERELRKMLEDPVQSGKTMPNMRNGAMNNVNGLSNSMSMLPSIAYNRGTVANKKEPKVFGGNPNISNKRKVARQGNLLTVSDSLPNLDRTQSTIGLGVDTVKVTSRKPKVSVSKSNKTRGTAKK